MGRWMCLTLRRAQVIIVPHRMTWSWYTAIDGCVLHLIQWGRDWACCSPPRPLLAVPNVTAQLSTASVPITLLLYTGPLLCSSNVPVKGFILSAVITVGQLIRSVLHIWCRCYGISVPWDICYKYLTHSSPKKTSLCQQPKPTKTWPVLIVKTTLKSTLVGVVCRLLEFLFCNFTCVI